MSVSATATLIAALTLAGQALDRCDLSRAGEGETALAALDPETATLYRLAWLERSAREASLHFVSDHEQWRDEIPVKKSCGTGDSLLLMSSLPESRVQAELEPWVGRYAEARPALRETLRGYLIWRWLKGERRSLPEVPTFSATEKCEWQALRFLNDPKSVSPECDRERGALWAIVRAAEGDALLSAGRPEEALPRYLSAIENLPDREVGPKLWYRVGVAGALSGGADDLTLRSLARVLPEADSDEGAGLRPVDLGVASNLACERLREVRGGVLRRIFAPDSLVSGLLKLGRACPAMVAARGRELKSSLSPIWRAHLELRLASLKRAAARRRPFSPVNTLSSVPDLRTDSLRASSAVAIPISLSPPPLEWKIEPLAGFLRGFEADAVALGRNGSSP